MGFISSKTLGAWSDSDKKTKFNEPSTHTRTTTIDTNMDYTHTATRNDSVIPRPECDKIFKLKLKKPM